jgi:hypothetical protein
MPMGNDHPGPGFMEGLRLQIERLDSGAEKHLICLGRLSHENPTVSHLLIKHPQFGKNCWRIVHSETNRDKPFHRIAEGKPIYLDTRTQEILWEGQSAPKEKAEVNTTLEESSPSNAQNSALIQNHQTSEVGLLSQGNERVSEFNPDRLPHHLKTYLGESYSALDCYELVVQGMKKIGVCYEGKEGLQHSLIKKALNRNLPLNAYLTGEGLIDASSTTLYSNTISSSNSPEKKAEEIIREVESSLEPGLILSCSMPKRGHMGVISRYGEQWTLINSGQMDNNVHTSSQRKGVGEEDLKAELTNWLRRAKEKNHSLRVTIGRLNQEKLSAYLKTPAFHASA